VLPAPARLRRREDFTLAVRRGRRAGRDSLVAHYLAPDQVSDAVAVARAGFVVGRAVGNSVVRHRTVRQLRHLVADRLDRLPAGSILVVRALPPAADADSAALGRDLDAALTRLLPAPAVTS
jgi:ribonuclease P protein component